MHRVSIWLKLLLLSSFFPDLELAIGGASHYETVIKLLKGVNLAIMIEGHISHIPHRENLPVILTFIRSYLTISF
jgi:hypothetical protein